MNEEFNFSLSKNSAISWDKSKKSFKIQSNEYKKNDYMFYSIINELSEYGKSPINERTLKTLLKKYKSKNEAANILNYSTKSIMSLSDIFIQNRMPLISLIWNLVFTLPMTDIVNLSKLINPIESKLLLSSEMMFNELNRDMIDEIINWSKWTSNFESNIPNLLKYLIEPETIDDNYGDLIERISACENEKKFLKGSPEILREFWNTDDLIDKFQEHLIKLIEKKKLNDNYLIEIEIHNKIKELKNFLVESKVPMKLLRMQHILYEEISFISEFTEEIYDRVHEVVNQFFTYVNNSSQENKIDFITWPEYDDSINTTNIRTSENIDLFGTLIWYSTANQILQEINIGKDLMFNLFKLSEYIGMDNSIENFVHILLMNSEKSNLDVDEKSKLKAKHALNSIMILTLWHDSSSFITDSQKICDVINNYMYRSPCDESELHFIYGVSHSLSPDLNLIIPTFEPIDLIYLIAFKMNDNGYRNGPMLFELPRNVFIQIV